MKPNVIGGRGAAVFILAPFLTHLFDACNQALPCMVALSDSRRLAIKRAISMAVLNFSINVSTDNLMDIDPSAIAAGS